MKIPKRFNIFNKTYSVVYNSDKCNNENVWGLAEYRSNTIYLCENADGIKLTEAEKEQVFIHEIIHVVLKESGLQRQIHKDELENFCDLFSNCLQQILNTSK